MPISAPPPSWASIKNKPTTVGGFGITDMASQSVASAVNATNATNASFATTAGNGGVTSLNGASGAVSLAALAAYASSMGANGYQKLPSGLIIQWGTNTVDGVNTFPIAFPNACHEALVSTNAASSSGGSCHVKVVLAKSTTSVTIGYKDYASAPWTGYNWVAFGY